MRRISERTREEWVALVAPGTGRDAVATRYSHPAWVVGQLQDALTADGRAGELESLLEADNEPAAVTLVARPGLVGRDELAAEGAPTVFSPWGVTLAGGDPSAIGAIASGAAAVQDEGSQLVAGALVAARDVEPGERWLDMCAGPGGKAGLLGALAAQHGATLEARELHPHRADLVRAAVRAVPVGIVTVSVGDARDLEGGFDRVLLDAPCTGLGALRRRPEARWRRGSADLDELVTLQRQLLATAARVVRPGGLVAYVTCSPVLAETRDVVAGTRGLDAIDARPAMARLTHTDAQAWGRGPHVQLWPHAHATDAMFLALFARPDAEDAPARQ
jgi:16S rRNA (cytosine967-C5)-methyltransferase